MPEYASSTDALDRFEQVAREARDADPSIATHDSELVHMEFADTFDPPTVLSLISRLRRAEDAQAELHALLPLLDSWLYHYPSKQVTDMIRAFLDQLYERQRAEREQREEVSDVESS